MSNFNTGWAWMIFRVYQYEGQTEIEILEHSAGYIGFECFEKNRFKPSELTRSTSEWYCEEWSDSSYKEEIAQQIADKLIVNETSDIYIEYLAEYKLLVLSSGYYGDETEVEENIVSDKWQEISVKEYDLKYKGN